MPNPTESISNRTRIKRSRTGSIIIETCIILPFLCMVAFAIINIQGVYKDQMRMHKAVSQVSEEVIAVVRMAAAVKSGNADSQQSISKWYTLMNKLQDQNNSIDLDRFFQEEVFLETGIRVLYKKRLNQVTTQLGLKGYGDCQVVDNTFIARGYIDAKESLLPLVTPQEPITYKIYCEGLSDYLKSGTSRQYQLYLTPHGINESYKFHTHRCWSLKQAKNIIPIELEALPKGFPEEWLWQGQVYTLCHFCRQERFGSLYED